MLRYLTAEVTLPRYRRIDLPVPDMPWENIPEPDQHEFRTPSDRPTITIYQKVGP
jgi:hypothetical protein